MSGAARRTHIVMVPGFGGFDVLGQIFYYAGVTRVLRDWVDELPNDAAVRAVSLHFFQNLPTAGVRSRALALRAYLEERVYRRIFAPGDRVAIVGHSTGGLDIRQLMVDLNPKPFAEALPTVVDPPLVEPGDLLDKIERLVFLSVPQRGTNIADFTRRFRTTIGFAVALAEKDVRLQHAGIDIDLPLPSFPPKGKEPDLLHAIADMMAEVQKRPKPADAVSRYAAVLARDAYGELVGWLDGVRTDFFAIDDLSFTGTEGASPTPARYDEATRKTELEQWGSKIQSRSYATLGAPPVSDVRKNPYELTDLPKLLTHSWSGGDENTDVVYRLAYAATAAGQFTPGETKVRDGDGWKTLEGWENDGIVNTASMLWPNGLDTRLVHGDHGDIIGHYTLSPPIKGSESVLNRTQHAYDLLGSNSGFTQDDFKRVWRDIFGFCAEE